MPYSSIDQLPPHVRNNLPVGAQRIFVRAFNSVYDKLEPGEDEVRAFKAGCLGAVKRKYEKDKSGKWVQKKSTTTQHRRKAS